MDRQALIEAACTFARDIEGDGYQKLLAELGARKAISLLTGQEGMFDPAFLPKGEIRFFQLADPVIADDADWYPTFEEMGAYLTQIAGPGATVVPGKGEWNVVFPFAAGIRLIYEADLPITKVILQEILAREVDRFFKGAGKACAAPSAELDDLDRELSFGEMDAFIRQLGKAFGFVSHTVSGNSESTRVTWEIELPGGSLTITDTDARRCTKRMLQQYFDQAIADFAKAELSRNFVRGAR